MTETKVNTSLHGSLLDIDIDEDTQPKTTIKFDVKTILSIASYILGIYQFVQQAL